MNDVNENAAPETPVAPAPETPAAPVDIVENKDSRQMAMFAHLGGLFSWLVPLIIWLIKKDEDAFVNEQGKEALNFQITVFIAMAISGLLMFVCVGFFTAAAVGIMDIIYCILAAVAVNKGEHYRYPISIRFIK